MGTNISRDKISTGAAYLYIEAISMLFSGYLYWLILSKIAPTSVIGTASAVISFATIFIAISALGLSSGMQRFLAKQISINDLDGSRRVIKSVFLLSGIGMGSTLVFILMFKETIHQSFNIEIQYVIASIFIIVLTVITNLSRYIIIASLLTKPITIASAAATIVKISITVLLLTFGTGVLGILVGYMLYFLTSLIVFGITIKGTLYKKDSLETVHTFTLFKDSYPILIASISFWIPNIINTAGSQLGTIFVFVTGSATSAGVYFIALSIFTGVSLVMSVLSTIAYPTIGSLKDGKKRATSKLFKISLVATLPISVCIIGYSSDIMGLFGSSYIQGSFALEILFLSMLPYLISTIISVLSYSYGNNKQVLLIGISSSLPRIIMYFLFVPLYDIVGAALSYLGGSMVGLFVSILIAFKLRYTVRWRQLLPILGIPILTIAISKIIHLNFALGITVTLISTYFLFLKLKILDKEDVDDIQRLMPKSITNMITKLKAKISN